MGGYDCRNHPLWLNSDFKSNYEDESLKSVNWYKVLRRAPEDSLLQYITVQILAKKHHLTYDSKILSTATIKVFKSLLNQEEQKLLSADYKFITGFERSHSREEIRKRRSSLKDISLEIENNNKKEKIMSPIIPVFSSKTRVEKKQRKLEWHLSLREFVKGLKTLLLVILVILLSIPYWLCPNNYLGECRNHAIVPTRSLSNIANDILKEIDSHPENLTPQKFNSSIFLGP